MGWAAQLECALPDASGVPRFAERELRGAELPPRLLDLEQPPEVLFVRGELPRGPAVAIVGTRKPSAPARRFARELARELAANGVAILSGGALGIDAAAHRGALDGGGVSVVVAPAGFARPYPVQHRELFRRCLKRGGAYLSLVPATVAATQAAFFPRNAVLAALCHVLVVVEAPLRSGARNAAACARRLGRLLYCVPAPPWHSRGRGCLAELRLGALPLEGPRDVYSALRALQLHPLPPAVGPAGPAQQNLFFSGAYAGASERERVLEAVRAGARFADEVCAWTGLPAGRVSELVLTLRLDAVLVTGPAGRLELANKPI